MWVDRDNDIESILKEENREKRKASSGARHNSGRRGGGVHGIKQGIRMPSDVLKANHKEEYKKYIQGGMVKVSNIYDDITKLPSLIELENMDLEKSHSIVKVAKDLHKNLDLGKWWGVSSGGLYSKVFDKYGIDYPHKPKIENTFVADEYEDITKIPSIEEFKKMDKNEVKRILISAKAQHTTTHLTQHWKSNAYAYYQLLDKYEVPYMHRGGKPKKVTKEDEKKSHHKQIEKEYYREEVAAEVVVPEEEAAPEIIPIPDVKEYEPEDLDIFQLKYIKTNVIRCRSSKKNFRLYGNSISRQNL
jgi:uncharacterized protein Usg